MLMKTLSRRLTLAVMAPLAFVAIATASSAQELATTSRAITVAKEKSAAFRLDAPIGEIVGAQPEMVQLVATTDHGFYIRGKAVGVTNLLIYDRGHHL